MRYGVIADIHANLFALEATLATLEDRGVDRYLCLGDLVGYGPQPNECVARVAELELEPACVVGNHDLIAVGHLSPERCGRLARRTLEWTREVLGSDAREYLAGLPLRAQPVDQVVLAHGSLDDPEEYVREAGQARAQLEELADAHPEARLLLLGHTHRRAAFTTAGPAAAPGSKLALAEGERYLLNPGSVGQSRERTARARFALIDLEQAEAEFFAVRYDVRGARMALCEAGLPTDSLHPKPRPWRARARRALKAIGR